MARRICALALAALMLLALCACGQAASASTSAAAGSGSAAASAGSDEPVTLTFWGHQQDTWNASYQAIADSFHEKYPNITIQYEFYPYDEFESKVQTSLISKTGGADIYELWGGWGVDFAPTGALAPMPDAMAEEVRSDAYPCTYGALEYDGKLYGMPQEFNIECGGLLVNKTLLDANGFQVATTWDELMTQAKAVTKHDGDVYSVKGFDPVNWDGIPYLFTSMILSQGGQYLNDDGTFNFTSPEAIKAFTELTGLYGTTTDLLGLTGGEGLEGYQQLFSGEVLYVPRGPWAVADGVSTYGAQYGTDFDYVSMPWYGDKPAFAAESGWAIGVNASSPHQDAAWKFLDYFFSDDVILSHNVACGQIPAKKSVAQDPAFVEKMPYAKPLVGILDDAQFIGYFNTDKFKEAINNVYVDYCTTKTYASAEDAMKALEGKLDGITQKQA